MKVERWNEVKRRYESTNTSIYLSWVQTVLLYFKLSKHLNYFPFNNTVSIEAYLCSFSKESLF